MEITAQITALLSKVYGETNEQDMYLSNNGLKDLEEIGCIGCEAGRAPGIIGVSLSEPHTSVISLHPCMCVCLLGSCLDQALTVSHFWFLFCMYVSWVIQK